MIYDEFISTVQNSIQARLGEHYTVIVQKIPKNNGTIRDGLFIAKTGDFVTPTIYLDPFFQGWKSGTALPDILDEIIQVYLDGRSFPQIEPEMLTDVSRLEDKIVYKLIHTKSNEILLQDVPSVPFLDLSIVFYLFLEEYTYGHMTALIHNSHMVSWNLDVQKMQDLASVNTPRLLPAQIKSIRDVIRELADTHLQDNYYQKVLREQNPTCVRVPFYILSNICGINGSCAILYDGILKNFADQLEKDLIILPSSIHEVILIPYDEDFCLTELAHMVHHVNATEVPAEERLSDEVYLFLRDLNQIVPASQYLPYDQIS